MSLIHEIHRQPHHLRLTLWALSAFSVISVVGYFWFMSFERGIFLALHDDEAQRAAFIAKQDARSPKTFAVLGEALGSLTAAIGGFVGIDEQEGFDRPASEDTVYMLPLSK